MDGEELHGATDPQSDGEQKLDNKQGNRNVWMNIRAATSTSQIRRRHGTGGEIKLRMSKRIDAGWGNGTARSTIKPRALERTIIHI